MPEKITETIKTAVKKNHLSLDNLEANSVISGAGILTPPTNIAVDLSQATEFAKNNGYPVVLKLSSPGLLHKKEVGGVILDIRTENQLELAWETLQRKSEGLEASVKANVCFQIQKEIPNGVEVIVGIKHDPTFGHILLIGAGGSLTELISDKNLFLLPIDVAHARELVEGSKVYRLLKGSDKEPPYALGKLYDLIVKLSKIIEVEPEIEEIEINPVIVTLNDVWAVDNKVILKQNKQMPTGPKFKTATTLSTELLAGKMRYFEFGTEEPFDIQPGQYISVKVSDTRINCYSIAGHSSPTKFDLLVDSTPGGPGSKFFEQLKHGDRIMFLGPFGSFILKQEDEVKTMLFLGTGCGTAPLKYMIEAALSDPKFKQNIKLYIGVNNFEDIFLLDYFKKLSEEHKNFSFEIAVNNPNSLWKGPTGFITALVKHDFPDASKCSAYMCGNKFMVEDITKMLTDNGCSSERIYVEKI